MHKKKHNLLLEFWVLFIAPSSMKRLRFSTLKKMEVFYKRGKMHFFSSNDASTNTTGITSNITTDDVPLFSFFYVLFFITLNSITKRRRSIDGLGIT